MPLDTAKLKERFEKKSGRGDRLELKDGENTIRLIPPSMQYLAETVDYIGFEYLIHYQLGTEGNKSAEICPKTHDRKLRCPICEAVAKLYRLNTAEDKALASQLRAKKRYLFNAIDLNDKEKGIQILEVGVKIYEDLVEFIAHPKWGDLLDLDEGRDITITKKNRKETKSGYEEYNVSPDPTKTSAREYLAKNFKEAIVKLQKSIPPAKTYEELKVILEGGDSNVDLGAVKATVTAEKNGASAIDEEEEDPSAATAEEVRAKPQNKVVQDPATPAPAAPTGPAPTCFGQLYGPRRVECVPCAFKVTCREKFLEM